MRYFIAICLLALPLVGCVSSGHDEALGAWYSPSSTLEQRAQAVAKLVPKGASRQSAERVLGANGIWTRQHSQSVNNPQGSDSEYLAYRFPSGEVCLFFEPSIGYDPYGFVRTEAYHNQIVSTIPFALRANLISN
jgi:hypothetical protein